MKHSQTMLYEFLYVRDESLFSLFIQVRNNEHILTMFQFICAEDLRNCSYRISYLKYDSRINIGCQKTD